MARLGRLEVLNTVIDQGLVPVFYHSDLASAQQIAAACRAGRAHVLELTNRRDFTLQVFTGLAQHLAEHEPDVILGVGSTVDAPIAALYLCGGANSVRVAQVLAWIEEARR